MKKTAQEIHNEQIEGLSNGMSIEKAKRLAQLKDKLMQEPEVKKQHAVWPYVMAIVIIIAYLAVSIYQQSLIQ
jgi:cytochrome c-type biogenesis protein CcmH/NrfG